MVTAVRGWSVVSALALALAWSGAALAQTAPACGDVKPYKEALKGQAPGTDVTRVPVVIHIMEREEPAGTPKPSCPVSRLWTSQKVGRLFTAREGVRAAWNPARIAFVVEDVRVQRWNPPTGLLTGIPSGGLANQPAWRDAFYRLAQKFHVKGHVNVYLWDEVSLNGHARFRSVEDQSTVWLGKLCAEDDPGMANCARTAAHEFGHAVGLYDVQRASAESDSCNIIDPPFQNDCRLLRTTCPEADDADRLMRPNASGMKLCRKEVEEAQRMTRFLR